MLMVKGLSERRFGQIVKEILATHTYMPWNKKEKQFTYEIYADYQDRLGYRAIKEIAKSDDPMGTFYDQLNLDDSYAFSWVLEQVEENWDEDKYDEYSTVEDMVKDWVEEHVNFKFPFDHYLNQDIDVNIILETPKDRCHLTNGFLGWEGNPAETIDEASSILWLVRQQGYTKTDLNKLVRNEIHKDNKFLKSVHSECINIASSCNALTFLVKMTLKEFIDLKQTPRKLTLSKDTTCGLYDPFSGGGSILEIQLEKPVTIPANLASIEVDGERRYSIKEVYGTDSRLWTGKLLPKPARKKAIC